MNRTIARRCLAWSLTAVRVTAYKVVTVHTRRASRVCSADMVVVQRGKPQLWLRTNCKKTESRKIEGMLGHSETSLDASLIIVD